MIHRLLTVLTVTMLVVTGAQSADAQAVVAAQEPPAVRAEASVELERPHSLHSGTAWQLEAPRTIRTETTTVELDQPGRPSVFAHVGRGFLTGTFVGVGGAYLVARRDGIEGDDWRTFVFGTGIGALTGSALGLGLGFFDLNARPGTASVALRDTMYGAGLGVLIGATAGSLAAVRTTDAEHIALGAAIGTVSGAALGLAIGLIEGPALERKQPSRKRVLVIGAAQDLRGSVVWTPAVSGTF
jgi:hypothetical protein